MDDIERELEFELNRVLAPISRVPIPARRSPVAVSWTRRLMGGAGGAGGALAFKVFAGAVAAAAAATVVAAATTGTLAPSQVSRGISEKVETCKADLQDGQHGIGSCVSAIAEHHGSSASDNSEPGKSGTAPHGIATGQTGATPPGQGGTPPGQGKGNDKDKGKATGQATPKGK
ncbi:MAG TPA: hypothetical protein VNA65_00215 [Candidatus Dormibacteraeota bacterium]|nr:hypothetical protein [Candidatus Dormibacteraeota bacterium]